MLNEKEYKCKVLMPYNEISTVVRGNRKSI